MILAYLVLFIIYSIVCDESEETWEIEHRAFIDW